MRVIVVAAALLGLLGGCGVATERSGQPAAELPPWAWELPDCVAYQPAAYAAPHRRVSVTDQAGTVTETYEPGWGERALADIRAVLRSCGSYEYDGFRERYAVVVTGFAGNGADESLLVEAVRLAPPDPPLTWYMSVVRYGDVVVTTRTATPELATGTPDRA